jgi:hypothetical protein
MAIMPATVEDDAPAPSITTRRLKMNYELAVKSINRFLETKDQVTNEEELCELNRNLLQLCRQQPGFQDLERNARSAKNTIFQAVRDINKARSFLEDPVKFAAARLNPGHWKCVMKCDRIEDLRYKLAKQKWEGIRLLLSSLRQYKKREKTLSERRLDGFRIVLSLMKKNAERREADE